MEETARNGPPHAPRQLPDGTWVIEFLRDGVVHEHISKDKAEALSDFNKFQRIYEANGGTWGPIGVVN